jgi:hypothetical protein
VSGETPPGWYPDPGRAAPLRWWDGSQWTSYLHPGGWGPGPHATVTASARRLEERMCMWARAALAAYWLLVTGEVLALLLLAGRLRRDLHRFLRDVRTAPPGHPATFNIDGLGRLSIAADLGQLLLVGVAAVFLVWQYNAATVARGLGYPARTSPGFGVGSWFIPVISLWFPYWALRDCLPAAHPMRRRALWAWLAYLTAGVLGGVSEITAFFSVAGAVIPTAGALVCLAVAVSIGRRLITAVNDDHRQALLGLAS